jgi:2-polyprenyl-3-methyl-5-hydroxy-6-metoxy-1,4-benzoquinol methylase
MGILDKMNLAKFLVRRAGQFYLRRICLAESQDQSFSHHNERSIEYAFALQMLGEIRPQSVLDVGTGTTAWPHLLRNCGYVVSSIDNVRDYWPSGMVNRHWSVLDVDILNPDDRLRGPFDAITCISVIEHVEDHTRAVQNMVALLAPSGILVLTTPYSSQNPHPNVYNHPEALYGGDLPYICRSSSEAELRQWLDAGLTLERLALWRLFTGTVWATGQRCKWERAETEEAPHQLGCFLFRKN